MCSGRPKPIKRLENKSGKVFMTLRLAMFLFVVVRFFGGVVYLFVFDMTLKAQTTTTK